MDMRSEWADPGRIDGSGLPGNVTQRDTSVYAITDGVQIPSSSQTAALMEGNLKERQRCALPYAWDEVMDMLDRGEKLFGRLAS